MQEVKSVTQSLPVVYEGFLAGAKPAVVLSGIGKLKAASAADYLFEHYSVDAIFSIGVAWALDPMLQKGDIVFGSSFICARSTQKTDRRLRPGTRNFGRGML
jgi:adenosylhomocysteine nucleosidase